jgi:hypothetical protein
LDFPVDVFHSIPISSDIASCFDKQPLEAYKGKTDYMLVYEKESDIRDIRPQFEAIAALKARGVIITAKGEHVDFVSRFFAPQSGIIEDPVTGSAHTTLTPYWSEKLNKTEMSAIQLSERKGYLQCKFLGNRVEISGQAKLYLAGEVYIVCESPIERVFLNSLILMCVRNRMPCFHFTPPAEDVLSYMQNYRDFHLAIIKHIQSYKDATGDDDLVNFEKAVQVRMEQGIYSQEQVEEIYMHNSIIKNFEWNSYKITIQAGFPNLKLNGKSLRTDLFIWVPGDDAVKIIIECDGYAYHSSKESFQNDRQRDRLFQMNGYKVIRFSGAEINRDPVKVSSELLDLLEVLDIDNAEKRIL